MESRLSSQIFFTFTLQIHFFRLKEVLLVTLLPLGALVTLVILVTTKDQMIQAGSCCPTEPKLEPNHHGVLQVPRQEREAETEMEFVDDPLTNPDLVTQVRINTIQDLISLAGCQIILIDLNFHLQKCLEIFD